MTHAMAPAVRVWPAVRSIADGLFRGYPSLYVRSLASADAHPQPCARGPVALAATRPSQIRAQRLAARPSAAPRANVGPRPLARGAADTGPGLGASVVDSSTPSAKVV